jgi:hypothetical protein
VYKLDSHFAGFVFAYASPGRVDKISPSSAWFLQCRFLKALFRQALSQKAFALERVLSACLRSLGESSFLSFLLFKVLTRILHSTGIEEGERSRWRWAI